MSLNIISINKNKNYSSKLYTQELIKKRKMNSKLDKSPYNNIYKLLDTIEDEDDDEDKKEEEEKETNLIIYLPNDIKNIILEYISHDQRMELLIHKYGLRFFIDKINKIPRSIFGIKKLYKYGNLLKSLLKKCIVNICIMS